MNEKRFARLEALGFQWDRTEDRRAWNMRYAELQTFRAANGHCNVPIKCKVSVETQRPPQLRLLDDFSSRPFCVTLHRKIQNWERG
jgi:Helicase associated domain